MFICQRAKRHGQSLQCQGDASEYQNAFFSTASRNGSDQPSHDRHRCIRHRPAFFFFRVHSMYDNNPSTSRKPSGRAYHNACVVPTRNANPFLCRYSSRWTRALVCSIAQRFELSCTTRSSRTSPLKRIKDGGTRKLPTVVKFLEYLAGLRRRQPSFSLPRMVVPFPTTPCHSLRLETAISACSHYPIR